jgi:hypothetical protein
VENVTNTTLNGMSYILFQALVLLNSFALREQQLIDRFENRVVRICVRQEEEYQADENILLSSGMLLRLVSQKFTDVSEMLSSSG